MAGGTENSEALAKSVTCVTCVAYVTCTASCHSTESNAEEDPEALRLVLLQILVLDLLLPSPNTPLDRGDILWTEH